MTKNYPTFRNLLRGAICNRTQAQFANESGISAEHLSRMLNSDTIHRPTKATLIKIATAAKNGITFQSLQDALDQDDGTKAHPSDEKLAEAVKDFCPDFRDLAHNTMKSLCEIIDRENYPAIVSSISDHIAAILSAASNNTAAGETLPIAYEMGRDREHFGRYCAHAKRWLPIWLSMADRKDTATSEMMVHFTELPCGDGETRYIIQGITCAVKAIEDQFGQTSAAMRMAKEMLDGKLPYPEGLSEPQPEPDEDGNVPEADEEVACMALAYEMPYYLDFSPVEHFKESYHGKGKTAEERLLGSIFGERTRWSKTIDGVGFWIDGIPDGLALMLSQHIGPVLAPYGDINQEEAEKRAAIETAVREWGILEDSPGVAKSLDDIGYQDPGANGDKGWPAAVAEIMRAETGFPFYYHAPAEDKSEFTGLSDKGCILIDEADVESMHIQREALLTGICRYAKMLGVETFGDILFTGVEDVFRKPMTYIVRENTGHDTDDIPDDEPECTEAFDRETSHPDKIGLYAVELKDGRRTTMCYITPPGVWVKAHKEWSHMIASYCPTPVKPDAEDEVEAEDCSMP